jgi:hypothetical protein
MDVIVNATATRSPFDGLGSAAVTAYHPTAPADEVEDAGQMLMKAYGGGRGLPVQLDLYTIVQQTFQLQRAEAAGNRMLTKALSMLYPEAAKAKARTEPWQAQVGGGGKYIPKPGIPFLVLRQLAKRIEVAQAIHRTINRKALRFMQPSAKPDEPGFELFNMDPGAVMDERQQDYLHWLTKFLMNGGREFNANNRKRLRRQTLPSYAQRLVADALTLDHGVTEKVPLIDGIEGLDSFYARDSATFYLGNFGRVLEDEEVYAYQLAYGTQEIKFHSHELAIWQRNLDSDLNSSGYGCSELESSVDTLSNWITAMAYTREGLDNNAIPRGFLSISGSYDRNTKELFKQAWDAKVRGVQNAHSLPVLFGQNGQTAAAQFVQTGQPFNEMAFAKWISLQSSIMSAIYGIDPTEIGMEGFTSANAHGLSGDDTEEKQAASRNSGFAPFMNSLAGHLRDELIAPFADWVGVRFTGLIDEDMKTRTAEKRRMMTINENRKELGMDPHPIGWFGELPADTGLMSAEFQRLSASMTYDEIRQAWGGLKVYPSELVGLAPMAPGLNAMYMTAAQAAGADKGDDGGDDPGAAGAPGNPFDELKPGQDDGDNGEAPVPVGQEEEGPMGKAPAQQGKGEQPSLFDEEGDGSLKSDVADKLKQV